MPITSIRALVFEDFTSLNQAIEQHLGSEVPLINEIGQYIIHSGGKRIRPLIHLLAARSLGYEGGDHLTLAAVIEFIHTATLLHDDVVDDSGQRRGYATANTVFGNAASVLVGDFLYSRAFQMMAQLQRLVVMDILSHATNVIAEGEVLQLSHRYNTELTTEQYFHVIGCKTAKLFEASAELAAVLISDDPRMRNALAVYGFQTGVAFQLMDDILDYEADPEQFGKNIGDDFREGKITLPIILTREVASPKEREMLLLAIQSKGEGVSLEKVQELVRGSGALEKAKQVALSHAEKAKHALEALPDSPYKKALHELALLAVLREY